MAYNVYSSNPPPFRAAQTGGPGFPPPSPGAGGNRGFSPTPKRSRSGGGKWVWIVLIVAAVLLFRSGVIRRILNGAQELADSVFEGAQSITNPEVKPSGQKPGSGTQPLITETVTVGDSALVSYRDAALDYREDGVYTFDATGVQTLELYWPAGSVSIVPYDGDEVEIREAAANGNSIKEDEALRYGMDGTVLFIQYCAFESAYSQLPAKTLTVLLPRRMASSALFAQLETGAAVLTIEDLSLTDAVIRASSGNIEATGLRAAGTLNIETRSGSAALSGEVEVLRFSSSSGDLRFAGGETLTTVSASASSGALLLTGNIHRAELSTSSGRVEIASPVCPYSLRIATSSGDVSLLLPEDADFSLEYAGGSGKLQSKLSTQMRDGKYVRGDGIAEFSVASGSGNLLLLPYTE